MPIGTGSPNYPPLVLELILSIVGEFFDVEELSKVCAATGRYTFFFSSWPLNMCVHSPLPGCTGSNRVPQHRWMRQSAQRSGRSSVESGI
jgi:hypothetical protein